MVQAEHLRPLTGFAVVCCATAAILTGGLTQAGLVTPNVLASPQPRTLPPTSSILFGQSLRSHAAASNAGSSAVLTPEQRVALVLGAFGATGSATPPATVRESTSSAAGRLVHHQQPARHTHGSHSSGPVSQGDQAAPSTPVVITPRDPHPSQDTSSQGRTSPQERAEVRAARKADRRAQHEARKVLHQQQRAVKRAAKVAQHRADLAARRAQHRADHRAEVVAHKQAKQDEQAARKAQRQADQQAAKDEMRAEKQADKQAAKAHTKADTAELDQHADGSLNADQPTDETPDLAADQPAEQPAE